MKRVLVFAAAICLAACGPAEDPSSDSAAPAVNAEQPIVNGILDNNDSNVACLYVQAQNINDSYLCSGSIIGPHSFLTAGHCAKPFVTGDVGVIFRVSNIDNATQAQTFQVGGMQANPTFREDETGNSDWNDIAMVYVTDAMPGPFVPLNRYPLDKIFTRGDVVREVGYGETSPDGGGVGVRRADTKRDVSIRSPGELETTATNGLTCEGDSGGPTLLQTPDGQMSVIAVTSRGDDQCAKQGIDTRVDTYLNFITAFMNDAGNPPSCDADGRCGFNCGAVDPDCPCAPDGFCDGSCVDDAGNPNPSADPDCPESCLFDGGTCIAPPKSTVDAGTGVPTDIPGSCSTASGAALLPLLGVLALGISAGAVRAEYAV